MANQHVSESVIRKQDNRTTMHSHSETCTHRP